MKLYRFSPIKNRLQLDKAIRYIHFSSYKLCQQSLGKYLPNSGNICVFCHYSDEYEYLTKLKKELTDKSDHILHKYHRFYQPIIISAKEDIPETVYKYIYIRQPDPYRYQVGDIDFYIEPKKYEELKQSLQDGNKIKGARIFPRPDLDMIEFFDPNIDVLAYITTDKY